MVDQFAGGDDAVILGHPLFSEPFAPKCDRFGGDGASGAWFDHKKVVLKFVGIAKDEGNFLSDLKI